MYNLTEENLKWAYKKLKSYVYYNSSPNYLKKKVLDFESSLSKNEISFKQLLENLNSILAKEPYKRLENIGINKLIYPKKDQLLYGDEGQILIKEFNIFVDMPIELFLVDILFTFILLEKIKEYQLFDKDVYGSIFDDRLYELKEPLKNNLIYKNHHITYKDWRNSALNKLEESTEKDRYLIKMDLKRCFYNIKFNFNHFLTNYKISTNSPVIKIIREVYLLYSYKLCAEEGIAKGKSNAILPIGLISSFTILNILLNDLDIKVKSLPGVISYSRYVDDILIIMDSNYIRNSRTLTLADLLGDIIQDQKFIIPLGHILEPIPININKQQIKFYKRGITSGVLRKNYKKVFMASLVNNDLQGDSCDESDDIGLSISLIRKQINNFRGGHISANEVLQMIQSLTDLELINCFTIWDEIFAFIYENETNDTYSELLRKISDIVEKCGISPDIKIGLKNTRTSLCRALKIEIDTIKELIGKDAQSTYFLGNIKQEDIIAHIKNIQNDSALNYFFPVDVSIEEVQFYLSTQNPTWEVFQEESNKLFVKINGYKLKEDHPFYNLTIKKELLNGRQIVRIIKESNANATLSDGEVNVAVVGLNMAGIKTSDFNRVYPTHYSYKDIIRIVHASAQNGAQYVLFPEFALLEQDVFDLIKTCKKLGVSIVIGLAHVFDKFIAKNYTLIYDNLMGIALLREKNYLPPEEKFLIAKNNYCYREKSVPEYVILHNELMTYSSMTCYETTSIIDRALLSGQIEVLFLPVYNKDTNYFSNIVYSFSRDASCFIAQSNHNEYGDSRITAPMKQLYSDIVKIKGGENNYSVVGKIKLNELRKNLDAYESILGKLDDSLFFNSSDVEKLENDYNAIKENNYKPLSAGIDWDQRKKTLGE